MRATIEELLRKRRRDEGPLPSIRELAREFDAAPLTIHKALRRLAAEGLVHAFDRKGYFWGERERPGLRTREPADERFASRFLADLRQGAYHPWKELPPRKALGQVYGVGQRSVGRILARLAERGILETRGRKIFPAARSGNAPGSSVLLIVRCDERGEILLDSERITDFIKALRRELAERDLGMIRLGYCERGGGRFLDPSGREIHPARLRGPLLGAILSTWLLQDPMGLLTRLERLGLPVSVWWEHPAEAFPRRRFRGGLAGFNLSFGASAGTEVGRHLASQGRLDVAFLSPFHGNEWSPARLRGLKESLSLWGGRVLECVDASVISAWHLERKAGSHAGMRRELDRILLRFLADPRLPPIPTWVMANDHAAVAMHALLRKRGGPSPHLIGFDNTSDSERLGFDSFEFHTDGMVRLMLLHLANPKAELFTAAPLREMIGRFVRRA